MDCVAQIIFNALPQCPSSHCVVPEGIHTPPFRRATEISIGGGGGLKRGNFRGGGGLLTEVFFSGGLSKTGGLPINKSFSVEQVFSYFSVTGIVYIDHPPTIS